MDFLFIRQKNSKTNFSQFFERLQNDLKILAFLQADELISPYYLLILNSYTRGTMADTNTWNSFSNTMLKVGHSELHCCIKHKTHVLVCSKT